MDKTLFREKYYKLGAEFIHKGRGLCYVSMSCYILEARNPDTTSIFVCLGKKDDFDPDPIEVSWINLVPKEVS